MKKNEIGFGALGILIIVLVSGLIGGAGWLVYNSQSNDNNSSSSSKEAESDQNETTLTAQQQAEKELQKELSASSQLEPVSAEEFGDFGNVSSTASPQSPQAPTKLGDKVSQEKYQGVVFQENGKTRVLVGKLKDISSGKIELSDGFELITKGNDLTLKVSDPNIITIETRSVIKWANLPDSQRMVKALLEYKANQ